MRKFVMGVILLWSQIGHSSGEYCENLLNPVLFSRLAHHLREEPRASRWLTYSVRGRYLQLTVQQWNELLVTIQEARRPPIEVEMDRITASSSTLQLDFKIAGRGVDLADFFELLKSAPLAKKAKSWTAIRSRREVEGEKSVAEIIMSEQEVSELLSTPLSYYPISMRLGKVLAEYNFRTIGDLVKKSELEFSRMPGLGPQSLREIKQLLLRLGLRFKS